MASPQVLEIPLVGGPADGETVRCVVNRDGRPPLTHPHGDGLAHAATYELTRDEEADGGWCYMYRPPPDEDADFAPEHRSPTISDQMAGGPEGRPEDDSPRGLAGHD